MTWRERKLQARFRGIYFHVEAHDRSSSRRLAVTELPTGDEPIVQDMGAGQQLFRVDAFVIGPDYMPHRDILLQALQAKGPGRLVHPWHGEHQVHVQRFSVREGVRAEGRADFSIQFLRVGAIQSRKRPGQSRVARIAAVNSAADKAQATASREFSESLRISGVAGFVVEAADAEVQSFAKRIKAQAGRIRGDAASLLRRVKSIADNSMAQLLNPSGFASEVFESVQEIAAGTKSREVALRVLLGLANPQTETIAGVSGQTEVARGNAQGFSGLFATSALASACKRAVAEDWPSRDAALAAREQLVQAIATQGLGVSHPVWDELHGLSTAIADVLPGPQGDLPGIRTVELEAPEPALVVAYRLQGSAAGAADIVSRNGIAHPMFVPASRPIEVLSNG